MLHRGAIDGLPGYVTVEADGLLQATTSRIEDGAIAPIYVIHNPDKLERLARALNLPPAAPAS